MAAVTDITTYAGASAYRVPSSDAKDKGRPRFKVGYVEAGATADDGDTITVDFYNEWGMTQVLSVEGFIHTTANSVIVQEAPTVAINDTKLVITVGGSTDNKQRFYLVYGL